MLIGKILFLIALSGNGSLSSVVFQNPESAKIEFLLKEIENLQGAKFWRNGTAYPAQAAADHLRMKWNKAGSTIKTAKDFIDKIASQSSVSGKAYQIEFADGRILDTRVFLYQKLATWKS